MCCFFTFLFSFFPFELLKVYRELPHLNPFPCVVQLQNMYSLFSCYFREHRISTEQHYGRGWQFPYQPWYFWKSLFSWLWNSQNNLTLTSMIHSKYAVLVLIEPSVPFERIIEVSPFIVTQILNYFPHKMGIALPSVAAGKYHSVQKQLVQQTETIQGKVVLSHCCGCCRSFVCQSG